MRSFNIRHNRKIVAVFSAIAVILFISMSGIIGYNNNWFRSRVYFHTQIDNAYGLKSLPLIYFKGFGIGRVKSFHLTDENKIDVKFYVFEDYYKKILKHSVVLINTNALSGDITEFQIITPDILTSGKELVEKGGLIPFIKSPLAQEYIATGKLIYEPSGIEGILDKSNQILKVFIAQKTSEKINEIIASTGKTMISIEETAKSFTPDGKGKGHRQIVGALDKVDKTIASVLETADYIKGTVQVVHQNRQELTPIIINTNKALEKASSTLEGINNNPLLRGGISKERKVNGAEMVQ
jgi:phospholipid/cholesterol/gamma-HCH transport system substrate-binding protein